MYFSKTLTSKIALFIMVLVTMSKNAAAGLRTPQEETGIIMPNFDEETCPTGPCGSTQVCVDGSCVDREDLASSCPIGDLGFTIGCKIYERCVRNQIFGTTDCVAIPAAKTLLLNAIIVCGDDTSDICEKNCFAHNCINDD